MSGIKEVYRIVNDVIIRTGGVNKIVCVANTDDLESVSDRGHASCIW